MSESLPHGVASLSRFWEGIRHSPATRARISAWQPACNTSGQGHGISASAGDFISSRTLHAWLHNSPASRISLPWRWTCSRFPGLRRAWCMCTGLGNTKWCCCARCTIPNAKLIEVLFAADALRRAGAAAPDTDRAVSVRTCGRTACLPPANRSPSASSAACSGAHSYCVITVQSHLHRTHRLGQTRYRESHTRCRRRRCWARRSPAAAPIRWWSAPTPNPVPGCARVAWRAGLPCVIAAKQRRGDRRVSVRLAPLPGARRAVLVDDIISSGATLAAAARALRRAGIGRIDAIAVHAIMASGARAYALLARRDHAHHVV